MKIALKDKQIHLWKDRYHIFIVIVKNENNRYLLWKSNDATHMSWGSIFSSTSSSDVNHAFDKTATHQHRMLQKIQTFIWYSAFLTSSCIDLIKNLTQR